MAKKQTAKDIKTLAGVLQYCQYSRFPLGDKWLTVGYPGWVVCQRKKYSRKTTELIRTKSLSKAVGKLMEGYDEELEKMLSGIDSETQQSIISNK